MSSIRHVPVTPRPLDRFQALVGQSRVDEAHEAAGRLRERLGGRVVWNLNSTAIGGGVAEMLRSFLGYGRAEGVDVRWCVIDAPPAFFSVTKRLHNALHGFDHASAEFDQTDRELYARSLERNAADFAESVRSGDVVILHDPQTAGLAPHLASMGAQVIWRCHIGSEKTTETSEEAWELLAPVLESARALIFSRAAYVPERWAERSAVIRPAIDPFTAKNTRLTTSEVRSILVHVGLIEGPDGAPRYTREDGSPGRVDHCADVLRLGRAPDAEAPLVVQVSRWDRLKDPAGVISGFGRLLDTSGGAGAHLILAGPNVHAVADDPEGVQVFDEVLRVWRDLPHGDRRRVHLASLPSRDVEENAVIVNALQRHAAVVVQKSLHEGFGLTVTEAMWKERPVLASDVGGIRDQVTDGADGLLLSDPSDLDAFARALQRLLGDPGAAASLGRAARERVLHDFLSLRSLRDYAALLEDVLLP